MKKLAHIGLFLTLAVILAPGSTIAQQTPSLMYAAKFICGKSTGEILGAGVYHTAINVHNPSDTVIVFKKKFATALPGEKPGPVTRFKEVKLGPDQALEIDCPDIFRHTRTKSNFLKGYVIIEGNVELDVVAVYTSAGRDRQVQALNVEHISPRRLSRNCPDLVVQEIQRPIWDSTNHRSVIRASIKNIGTAPAAQTIARVIDPSTPQPTGAPYNAIADTPALAPDFSTTVTFYLPYWVYNPDVTLEVTADYKNTLSECNEGNNVKVFQDIG